MAGPRRLAGKSGVGLLLCVFAVVVDASVPYTPTRLFLSSPDNSSSSNTDRRPILYQLDPPSPSYPQGALRSLSLDQDLDPNSLPFKVVSSSLPFVTKDSALALLSASNVNGSISVYVGNCAADASTSALWRYSTDTSAGAAQNSWTQLGLDSSGPQTQAAPNFLASSILFSPTTLDEDESMYVFGGMCPDGSSAESDWTTGAQYSNQLVRISPGNTGGQFSRQVLQGLGQPIAEAGFTMTPLAPAVVSSSQGALAQQQSFLLLGGHTKAAFLNMSQVALFSLPEASWTFIPIEAASDRTDLRGRAEPLHVEPRSGHTAVLSADGSQVIVVGGWVGDVSTPAEPQIVTLKVGQGYGGSAASWTWDGATSQSTPFDDGSGIYGHGAVMLPGNIMMVSGGFAIPASAASSKRADQGVSDKVLFFNVTSGSFLSSYSIHLAHKSYLMSLSSTKGPLTTASQKAGLGVGLGLGLLAVAAACLFGCLYWRRRQKSRDEKSQYNKVFLGQRPDPAPMEEKHDAAPFAQWDAALHRRAQERAQGNWAQLRDADRTGLDVDVPSPSRGLRKGRGPLNSHLIDHGEARADYTLRAISPIDERPEHDRVPSGSSREYMRNALDPFRDPEPSSLHEAKRVSFQLLPGLASQGHHHDPRYGGHAQGAGTSDRRDSPDRSTRTTSTLSEQSRPESDSRRHSHGPQSSLHDTDPFVSPVTSRAASLDLSVEGNSEKRAESLRNGQSSALGYPPSSERSAQDVMAESQRLLGRTNRLSLPSKIQIPESQPRTASVVSPITPDTKPTFTIIRKDSQQGRAIRLSGRALGSTRLGSWVGSVRRGLAYPNHGYQRSASMNSVSAANYLSNNYHNPTGGFVEADQYTDEVTSSSHGGRSSSSSPTKLTAPIHKIRRKQVPTDTADVVTQRPTPRRVMSDSSGHGYCFWGDTAKDDPAVAERELGEDEADEFDVGRGLLSREPNAGYYDDDDDYYVDNRVPSSVVADVARRRVLHSAPHGRLRVVNRGDDDDGADDGGSTPAFVQHPAVPSPAGDAHSSPAAATKVTGRVEQQVRRLERARQHGVVVVVDSPGAR